MKGQREDETLMADDGSEMAGRGCIKTSRGPWIVRRETKSGGVVTKFRYPKERERQKNTQRERKRRAVTRKIFAGLREYGNYKLPKHADSNDLLIAVCEEAGWHVEEDGTTYRKGSSTSRSVAGRRGLIEEESGRAFVDATSEEEDYCTCNTDLNREDGAFPFGNFLSVGQPNDMIPKSSGAKGVHI